MKAVTVVGTLATVLALSACGQADEGAGVEPRIGETEGAVVERDAAGGVAPVVPAPITEGEAVGEEPRIGETEGAGVERDAAGGVVEGEAANEPLVGNDTAAGTTINTPTDAAPTVPGNQDAVVIGEPQPGQAMERAGESLENAGERAGTAATGAGEQAVDATAGGVGAASDAISDAAITASVNAELARDDELSALGINVDTDNSRVTLRGTAPNEAAAQRATELAQQVRGVQAVENELTVEAR